MSRKTIAFAVALLCGSIATAYDFSAVSPSGHTLYYSYVTGGVEVTYPADVVQPINGWSGYTKPTGALEVPSMVANGGTTYNVVAVHGHAFYECTGLTSVVLSEGVSSIGNSSFNGCSALSQITLPASLQSIGNSAFYGCTSLATIYCNASNPPTAANSTFQNTPTGSCVLHVPCQSGDSYSTTAPWSIFENIVPLGCSATLSVSVNNPEYGSVTGGGIYDVGTSAVLTAVPADGYFFACWNDGDTVNPRVVSVMMDVSLTAWFFAMQRDTVQVHDTVTMVAVIEDTVLVHDTTTVNLVLWDTLYVHDTAEVSVVLWDTVYVHDTTTVNLVVWDTVTIHDTVTISVDGTDTLYIFDTVLVHDTVLPTFFRLQVESNDGGVGIGNAVLPAGTVAEIGALPLEGYTFIRWNDGSVDNPRQVTLTSNATYTAEFGIVTAIDEVYGAWGLTVDGRALVVNCEPGSTVGIFSSDGRRLMTNTAASGCLRVWMPAAGVYLVQVDQMPARKVVINR